MCSWAPPIQAASAQPDSGWEAPLDPGVHGRIPQAASDTQAAGKDLFKEAVVIPFQYIGDPSFASMVVQVLFGLSCQYGGTITSRPKPIVSFTRLKSLLTSVLCTEFFCEWAAIAIAPLLIPGLLEKLARERKLTGHTSKYMLVPRGHLRGRAKIEA